MKQKNIFLLIPFLCALSIAKAQDSGTIRFAKIISDNMVLQQQKPITLWGWAKPKVTVKITLTQDASLGKPANNRHQEPWFPVFWFQDLEDFFPHT